MCASVLLQKAPNSHLAMLARNGEGRDPDNPVHIAADKPFIKAIANWAQAYGTEQIFFSPRYTAPQLLKLLSHFGWKPNNGDLPVHEACIRDKPITLVSTAVEQASDDTWASIMTMFDARAKDYSFQYNKETPPHNWLTLYRESRQRVAWFGPQTWLKKVGYIFIEVRPGNCSLPRLGLELADPLADDQKCTYYITPVPRGALMRFIEAVKKLYDATVAAMPADTPPRKTITSPTAEEQKQDAINGNTLRYAGARAHAMVSPDLRRSRNNDPLFLANGKRFMHLHFHEMPQLAASMTARTYQMNEQTVCCAMYYDAAALYNYQEQEQ
jgi:hypothetical protein